MTVDYCPSSSCIFIHLFLEIYQFLITYHVLIIETTAIFLVNSFIKSL